MSYGEFVQIETSGEATLWKRLRLGETAGRNEAWLRDTLQARPELLPVADIDPSFGPLIPVCTELRTDAGPIDNVFINQHGRLTLVECKLWRNQESRRKVVAQVLDYATRLSKWSYAQLQAQVSARTGQPGNHLFELVKARHPDTEEHRFADSTTKALRSGRLLLLVAGDGIREDVSSIGEFLTGNATSAFSFGMVEVALFEGPASGLLIQPRTIAHSRAITRTVILLQDGTLAPAPDDVLAEKPEADPVISETAKKIHAEAAAWWAPIVDAKLDDPEQPEFRYHWPHNVRGALPWPGTWVLAYRTSSGGSGLSLGVCLSGREVARAELLRALQPQSAEILSQLPEGAEFDGGQLVVQRRWDAFKDDDQRRKWLLQTINAFVNALRPRIRELRIQQET
jgi:hypothetical protein